MQDKDTIIAELNRELSTIKDEVKELNHNNQVIEKKMLKTQEDHDMMKSKYESYKDIEVVSIFFSFILTTMSFYGSDVLLNIESSLSFNFIRMFYFNTSNL